MLEECYHIISQGDFMFDPCLICVHNTVFRLSPHLKRISGLAQRKISIKYEIISHEYKFERTTSRR